MKKSPIIEYSDTRSMPSLHNSQHVDYQHKHMTLDISTHTTILPSSCMLQCKTIL